MLRGQTGVLLRVENGTVIGFDETGLILRLSDTTLADLRARLDLRQGQGGGGADGWIDPATLGDIDAWGLRRVGDWIGFQARLAGYDGPRGFRRHVTGGDIMADTAGPVLAVLSLGGARRAWTGAARPAFPAHVLSPGDDLGPVGGAGESPAVPCDRLQQVTEATLDTMTADALLRRRVAAGRAQPLIVARCETDASVSATALCDGPAMAQLEQVIRNTAAAATVLGTRARIASVALDFGAEDVVEDETAFVAAMHRIMDRIAALCAALHMQAPLFHLRSDETGARVREHWQLAVFPGVHRLTVSAPGYMFDFDGDHRPTAIAMEAMAAMESHAIDADLSRTPWSCPRPLLAESTGPAQIRVTFDGVGGLVLDGQTLRGVAGDLGFSLFNGDAAVHVTGVHVDPGDPLALLLDHPPGALTRLHYAVGRRGGVRDGWAQDGLHRWAIPADLPVAPC